MKLYLRGTLFLFCFIIFSCGQQSEVCVNSISPFAIETQGRPCKNICDCNNQLFEGVCSEGKCNSKERGTCTKKGLKEECQLIGNFKCTKGFKVCQDEGLNQLHWGDCKPPSDSENNKDTCLDNTDNDCDGAIDLNDDGCQEFCRKGSSRDCPGKSSIGACVPGKQSCGAGNRWTKTCQGITGPIPEICNGSDDDCDGEVDEDFKSKGLGQKCELERGKCKLSGVWVCSKTKKDMECDATIPNDPEVCDGKDNDCDGEIDENFDFKTDNKNCGACGVTCLGGTTCKEGKCICPDTMTSCNGTCVNVENNSRNCGSCGQSCPTGQSCLTRKCIRWRVLSHSSPSNKIQFGSIASDARGYLYITGTFEGNVTFADVRQDTSTSITTASLRTESKPELNGLVHHFITSYSYNGYSWAQRISYAGNYPIKVLAKDAVYAIGTFRDKIRYSEPNTKAILSNNTSYDVFVAKLNPTKKDGVPDGGFVWLKTWGGTQDESGIGIASMDNKDIVIAGNFTGNFTLKSKSSSYALSSPKAIQFYVAKLSQLNGEVKWAIQPKGKKSSSVKSIIRLSSTSLALAGEFHDELELNDQLKLQAYWTSSQKGMFVATLSNSTSLPSFRAGKENSGRNVCSNPNKDQCPKKVDFAIGEWFVTSANADYLYTVGRFRDNVVIGYQEDGREVRLTTTGKENTDFFLIKYNQDLKPPLTPSGAGWVKKFGNADEETVAGVTLDTSTNHLYIAGTFENSITFGSQTLTSRGKTDIFVVKLDSNGNVLWAQSAGGPNKDTAKGIKFVGGVLFLTGQFEKEITFGPDNGVQLTSSQTQSSFLVDIDERAAQP